MSKFEDYTPTPAEESVAQSIDLLVDDLLSGKIAGIAVCAVNTKGEDAFFYLNKAEEPVLHRTISKLVGLYQSNQEFGRLTTAPKTNRSYRSH